MYAPIIGLDPDIWYFTHCNNNYNNNNNNGNNAIKRNLLQYVSGMLVFSKLAQWSPTADAN